MSCGCACSPLFGHVSCLWSDWTEELSGHDLKVPVNISVVTPVTQVWMLADKPGSRVCPDPRHFPGILRHPGHSDRSQEFQTHIELLMYFILVLSIC